MRIDLNPKSPEIQDTGRPSRDSVSKNSSTPDSTVQDEAQFSWQAARVEGLEKQVNTLPEIRQARVESLRAAVQSGRYSVSPGNIAEAVFSAMISSA